MMEDRVNSGEISGRTIEEAVERALAELGASRDDVEIEILQEPRPALFGLGGRDARVRVRRRAQADATALAGEIVAEMVRLMGYDVKVTAEQREDHVLVTLTGAEVGGLIGRHGQTLDAMQLLVALNLARQRGRKAMVVLDAEGYRARRERTLKDIAYKAADRAVRERKPVFLEPMDARDRRTVHLTLRDDRRVTTSSEGEEQERRVVVHPEPGVAISARGLPEGLPVDDEDDTLPNG